jgi:hypothetical protein
MSASFWSSIVFVLLLAGAVVLNELEVVRRRGVDVKIGLFVLCVFCFWSMLVPLLARHVGRTTFAGALIATLGVLWLFYHLLRRRVGPTVLRRQLLVPGLSVSTCFLLFYLVGLIPPVPIAARKFGVYHGVERDGGAYVLRHERPWWKFWQAGDQSFAAQPGDTITVFAAVFSPARFDDTVYIRWQYHDARTGWRESDRIPINITGGRQGGFRGFATKQNYTPGDWRVTLETRDGREISRLYLTVTPVAADPARVLASERY